MTTYRVAEMAHKYTEHDMIETYTELPPLPDVRAKLLYCFLNKHRENDKQSLYTLAVSLAQLGLDTHDLVEPQVAQEPLGQARSRQMKVLAGDYFNGRFYQLLSNAERVDVVRIVSKAICEVNRIKMSMYEKFRMLKLSAEEYMEQSVLIRSELFLSFAGFISPRYAERYAELLRSFARCEVISEEIDRSDSGEIRNGWIYLYMLQSATPDDRERFMQADKAGFGLMVHKYKIHGLLSAMLQAQLGMMGRLIEQFDSDALKAELRRMLEPFALRISVPWVAEEI